jgi:MFS family permease
MTSFGDYCDGVRAFSRNARFFILGGVFNGLGMSVFGLLFNLYLKEHGVSETEIGAVLAAGSLGAAVAAVPAAMILERVGTRKVLIWSVVLAGLCYAAQALTLNVPALQVLSFVGVMILTFYRIASSPFLMQNSGDRERIFVFSLGSAAGMLSSLMGFLLGGYLPSLFMATGMASGTAEAQRSALLFSIAASLVSVIPFMKICPQPPAKSPVDEGVFRRFRTYDWAIISRLMVPKVLVGLGAGLVIPFMNLYFRNEFDLGSDRIGIFFSLMQVGLFLGMVGAPLVTRRFGMVNSIVLTELVSVPFMLVLALTRDLPFAVAAFILRGTLMNMNLPISANFEMELVKPEDRPFTNAVSSVAWNGAWTVSAAVGGAVIERYSFAWSFYLTIFFYLLSAGSYYLLLGRGRFGGVRTDRGCSGVRPARTPPSGSLP